MQNKSKGMLSGRELITTGLGFATEFPIAIIIMAVLFVLTGFSILSGFFALISLYFAILLAIFLIVRNSKFVSRAPMSAAIVFGIMWLGFNVAIQYSHCNVQGSPFNFICGIGGAINIIGGIGYYFIPAFLVFGGILWLIRFNR